MARILELVQEGVIAADIARRLDMSKPHVSYYITKAKEAWIYQTTHTRHICSVESNTGR